MPTERTALLAQTGRALGAAEMFLAAGRARLVVRVAPGGKVEHERFATEQLAAHALAWMASYVEALRQMRNWAVRLDEGGKLGEIEALILETAFGEYLAQLAGGIAMAQGEFARPQDLGLDDDEIAPLRTGAAGSLSAGAAAARLQLGARLAEARGGRIRRYRHRRSDARDGSRSGAPLRRAGGHAACPGMASPRPADPAGRSSKSSRGLGVFGMTIPEEHGGLGLGKTAMSIVSEELSRAYIGVGSLGTRSEIAGELIRLNGTDAQKARWLPAIASGAILPTAVFTEPNTGSDLASLQTRAVRDGEVYRIHGAKTWITHGARSDLMTLLARTDLERARLCRAQHVPRREAARQ